MGVDEGRDGRRGGRGHAGGKVLWWRALIAAGLLLGGLVDVFLPGAERSAHGAGPADQSIERRVFIDLSDVHVQPTPTWTPRPFVDRGIFDREIYLLPTSTESPYLERIDDIDILIQEPDVVYREPRPEAPGRESRQEGPTPTPTATSVRGGQPDLQVKSIIIRGAPDAPGFDCMLGENIAQVIVVNAGQSTSAPFPVHLEVGGGAPEGPEQIGALGPLQAGVATFRSVNLAAGPNALHAVAETAGGVKTLDRAVTCLPE